MCCLHTSATWQLWPFSKISWGHPRFKGSLLLSICPESSTCIKTNMTQWTGMIMTGENELLKRKPVPMPACSPHLTWIKCMNHGTTWYIQIDFLPHREQTVSTIKTKWLLLKEVIINCSKDHTASKYPIVWARSRYTNVPADGVYSNHWLLEH